MNSSAHASSAGSLEALLDFLLQTLAKIVVNSVSSVVTDLLSLELSHHPLGVYLQVVSLVKEPA